MKSVEISRELADKLDEIATGRGITRDEAAEKCLRLAFADPAFQQALAERAKTRAA
jgi:predicted transcriptional regulator